MLPGSRLLQHYKFINIVRTTSNLKFTHLNVNKWDAICSSDTSPFWTFSTQLSKKSFCGPDLKRRLFSAVS